MVCHVGVGLSGVLLDAKLLDKGFCLDVMARSLQGLAHYPQVLEHYLQLLRINDSSAKVIMTIDAEVTDLLVVLGMVNANIPCFSYVHTASTSRISIHEHFPSDRFPQHPTFNQPAVGQAATPLPSIVAQLHAIRHVTRTNLDTSLF